MLNRKEIKKIKDSYKKGDRIVMLQDMEFERIKKDYQGTVSFVDDMGHIHMNWDCGSSLAIIPDVDSFAKI